MNDKTILNVKLDKKLKSDAQELAAELGIPLSTVVNANLKEFVRSRSFSISAVARLKPEIVKEIGLALSDAKAGKNISPTFTDPKKAADYIRKI